MVNVELSKVDNWLHLSKLYFKLLQVNIYAYKIFEK